MTTEEQITAAINEHDRQLIKKIKAMKRDTEDAIKKNGDRVTATDDFDEGCLATIEEVLDLFKPEEL